ncbi:hypothetical protein Vadar_005032 [Vaccinium darrowii]|uniref:Uncharacterized protein n=1 Tax=Vaccinium darrowii TaxID=229202 RepID=A0ACB7WXS4_9ERIC|nr:hypothetical protein Vadar_005032 [Vaccinium darrowii]
MPNSIREGVNCSGGLRQTKVVKSDIDSSKEGINRNGSHKDFFENNGRSYAQVLYGDKFPIDNDTKAKATTRISVNEIDSERLSRSVVAKLKSLSALESIREAIHRNGVPVLEVKDMGGLWVVVTFPSSEQTLSIFDRELSWLNNWFDEVKKWSPTFEEARSRNIWISCYGVPLVQIRLTKLPVYGGEVLAIDDATAKGLSFAPGKIMIATKKWDRISDIIEIEVKGNFYEIRAVEEQVVIHGHVSVCGLDSSRVDSPVKMDNSKANSVDEANSRRDMDDCGWMKNNVVFKSCSNEVLLVEDSAVLVSHEVLVAEKGACVKMGDNSIQGDDSMPNSIEEGNACEKVEKFFSQEVDSKTDSTEHHHNFNEGDRMFLYWV